MVSLPGGSLCCTRRFPNRAGAHRAPELRVSLHERHHPREKLLLFKPDKYFTINVHIDGPKELHDRSVCREGVYDKAVEAIREALRQGYRVTTNTTFSTTPTRPASAISLMQ